MECLENFIGISGRCGGPPSKSLMYIEDIPGFTIKNLASIEGGKYLTVQEMLNAKLRIVGQELSEYIGAMLGEVYIENSVDSLITKNFDETYLDQEDGNPGLRIEKYPTALSSIFIPYIYFKSHIAVQNLVITVTDGFNPQTFTIDAAADEEVQVECNYSTTQRKVDITYSSSIEPSSSGVAPYTCDISVYDDYCRRLQGCSPCIGHCPHRYLRIHGLNFAGEESTKYYGIRSDIQLICNKEKMVCLMINQNKLIPLYSVAIKVLDEIIWGDRFNFFATQTKELAKETKIELLEKISVLWATNGPGILTMLQNAEKKCFNCTGYKYYEQIP